MNLWPHKWNLHHDNLPFNTGPSVRQLFNTILSCSQNKLIGWHCKFIKGNQCNVKEVQRGLSGLIFNTASKHDRDVAMFGKK